MKFALLYGADEFCAKWAAERLEHVGDAGFGPCRAIAVAAANEQRPRIWGVVVFHDWQPKARTCQVSVASESPLWAQPRAIRELLAIPFADWDVYKLWVAIPHTNERSLRFNRHIGMKQEAILRHHFGYGIRCHILSMLRPVWEQRWRIRDGQEHGLATSAA